MSHDAINQEQFGDYTLRYRKPDMDYPRHSITALNPTGFPVGSIHWHPETHAITNVNVRDEEQRKGIATAMWKMGQQIRPKPVHSADRTRAGEAWAKSVGGRLPRRKKVYDPFTKREV
jgi:hypothetical protein